MGKGVNNKGWHAGCQPLFCTQNLFWADWKEGQDPHGHNRPHVQKPTVTPAMKVVRLCFVPLRLLESYCAPRVKVALLAIR